MDPLTEVVVGELVKNIVSILQENISLIKGVKKDAEKLSSTLSAVQAVLEDAEATQFKNKSITVWLRKLKHATYDAEDILGDLSLEAQIREQEEEVAAHPRGCTGQVSHSVSTTCFDFNHIKFRHKIAKKLKSILGRFDEIADERIKFGFKTSDHVPSQTESEVAKMRETSSDLSEPKIYGRDEDIKEVIDMLVDKDHSRTENVFILPIVGIGGLGKTTLAQLVYNNERIVSSFEKRIWVCVSEPFYVKRVLKQILDEPFDERNFESLDHIKRKVVESLKDKKYLLVLDDVWNKEKDKWNELRSSLTSGASGSSIMVTTRSTRVASITSGVPPYNLEGLSNEQCWYLLKSHALGEKGEEEHPELVPIGIDIAKKCKGVPLVAKSLGSLLESKTNKDHWVHVRDSPLWNLEETEENKILPALRLSYNHLPSRLKQCFSYCSIYPKDSILNRIKLIYLWMANGFIQTQGRLEIEEVGDNMFIELLRLSFFQDTEEDDYGSIETCKMHDLMHDLACSVMVDECLIAEVGQVKGVVKTIRHLTVVPDSEQLSTVPDCVMTSESSFRTLSFFEPINFHSFKFSTTLRALNLKDMGLTTLPNSICQLQHLRYLDLSSNSLKSLPEFICWLRNLQMLDLSHNRVLTTLPLSIGTLQHLRYLNLSRTTIESSVIDRLSNLENLRYLDLSGCTSLPESTGRLKNLQRLNLSRSGITSLPVSIGNMESLRYLDLSYCEGIRSLPESVGGLRNLESLILSGCGSLEVLVKRMRNMSSLRHLDLQGTWNLTEMPVGLGESTCLQTLPWFEVGADSECGGIKELHGLNQLRGELEIMWLENVRNAEDGKEAKLSGKRFLKELTLTWGRDERNNRNSNCKEVLEGLLVQPPPNLQTLRIFGYPGACFHQGIQHLTSLQSLRIDDCGNLRNLEIGYCKNLASLHRLEIWNCSELELETENLQHLTSLRELHLESLPKLRALSLPQHLTMLQTLHISHCKNLRRLPDGIQHLTTLQSLSIINCHEDLHTRCEKEKGDDWHLISHIPHITIYSQTRGY